MKRQCYVTALRGRGMYVLELCHGVSRQVGLSPRKREPIKTDSGLANLKRKAIFGRQF